MSEARRWACLLLILTPYDFNPSVAPVRYLPYLCEQGRIWLDGDFIFELLELSVSLMLSLYTSEVLEKQCADVGIGE